LAFQENPIKTNERNSEEGMKERRCKEKEGRKTIEMGAQRGYVARS